MWKHRDLAIAQLEGGLGSHIPDWYDCGVHVSELDLLSREVGAVNVCPRYLCPTGACRGQLVPQQRKEDRINWTTIQPNEDCNIWVNGNLKFDYVSK